MNLNAKSTSQNPVVIIGGGLAGLTAAVYLAQSGANVTVYEKSAEAGGRAATGVHEGFRFNRGIHALYPGGATEQVLNELNIPYSGGTPSNIKVLHQGKLHAAPVGVMSLLSTGLLSIADKLEVMRVFSMLPGLNPDAFGHISAQAWIDSNTRRDVPRALLIANARTFCYTAALDKVSADVFIRKTQLAAKHGVQYIDGGWQTLVEGLRQKAEQSGAQFVSHTRVESVQQTNGQIQSVVLGDGSVVAASAVIVATTPQDAARLIDESVSPDFRAQVNRLIPAQLACLDVALSRLPRPDNPVVQDLERPLFMSTQSLYSKVAPDGGALIYAFKQLDPTQPGDAHADERELENFLDAVQPGWRDVLVKRFFLPRIQAIGTLPNPETGGYAGRPKSEVSGVRGLYLAGDWIGDDGFLADASFASARYAARQILAPTPESVGTRASEPSAV